MFPVLLAKGAVGRLGVVCTVALGLLAFDLTPARAAFGPAVTLAVTPDFAGPKMDAAGNTRVVWSEINSISARIYSRRISAAGVLGPVQTIETVPRSAGSAGRVAFALLPNGNAVIAWVRYDKATDKDSVHARTLSSAGVLGPVHILFASKWRYPDVTIGSLLIEFDAKGNAMFVWWELVRDGEFYGIIHARRLSASGRLSAVLRVGDGFETGYPYFALAPNGKALVGWLYTVDEVFNYAVAARTVSPAGVLGPIRYLKSYVDSVEAVIDSSGKASVFWAGPGNFEGPSAIGVRSLSAGGSLGAEQDVSRAGDTAARELDVGIAADGDTIAVWSQESGIRLATRSSAGRIGPVEPLSIGEGHDPAIGVFPDGGAVIAWLAVSGQGRILVRTRSAAGVLGPAQRLAGPFPFPTTNVAGGTVKGVAVSPSGRAVVVWGEKVRGCCTYRFRAAVGP